MNDRTDIREKHILRNPRRFRERLEERLDPAHEIEPGHQKHRPAAVLVPVVPIDDEPHLLFLRRPETMAEHSGQVAFPGGKIDPGEDPVTAALREANEELGLQEREATILGRFPGIPTITNYWVQPTVAWFDAPPRLIPNPREVDETFYASVQRLLDPSIYTGNPVNFKGRQGLVDYFNYPHPEGEKVIWGATGRLVHQFLVQVLDWQPPGVDPDFEPEFV